jgi:uncharacterized protein
VSAPNPSSAIAAFVKTPGLSPIKTRLAASIGQSAAEEFYRLSVQAVAAVVRETCRGLALAPYWAVAEGEGMGDSLWTEFARIPQGCGGLGERLGYVYDELGGTHDERILIGADAPQLTPSLLRAVPHTLCEASARGEAVFVIGRARDGGFYLFAGYGRLDRDLWRQVAYSRSDTADQMIRRLTPHGRVVELPPLTDADTVDDLPRVRDELRSCPSPLSEQIAVADWIDRNV